MERIFRIIDILLKNEEPITINDIANNLKMSNKTIRNDLKKAEEYLEKKGLNLIKKPRVGIKIEGAQVNKLNLANEINGTQKFIEPFSPEARKNYILRRLFMNGKNVTIKEIAEELYVSKVTIHKDLVNVEKWLEKFNLELFKKTNYGIEVRGKEENWRNAAASLIALKKQNEELKELLFDEYKGRIDFKTLIQLRELIDLDYKKLEKIVVEAEEKLRFRFSNEAFISLIIHIAISIKRLKENKDIKLPQNILNNFEHQDEYYIAQDIAIKIEEDFQVKLPESEIGYIFLHILGGKMQQNKIEQSGLNVINENDHGLAVHMAKEIINIANKVFSIDLDCDEQLLKGLILHLIPTINRVKYGLTLRNPMIEEIKFNYPEIYGVAWLTSSVFEKYLGNKISEEEIGYIALHIGAAVERHKQPLKALVVCTSGIGTSQLLAARLEKHFREIEIKDIVPCISLNKDNVNEVDFIISTIPIEVIDKPIINISPLLTQNDVKKLDGFIEELEKSNRNTKSKLNDFIDEELIETKVSFNSKKELIKDIGFKLYSKGYVKKEYIEDVLKREKISSTEIGNGIAIPHGSPCYVNKSQIIIITLDTPIKWGSDMIDIVFFMCVSQNDVSKMKGVIKELYNKIESTEFLTLLRNSENKTKIKNSLQEVKNAD